MALRKPLKKNLDSSPDETKRLKKGKFSLVRLGNITIGRGIFQPGFECDGGDGHMGYIIEGRIHVKMHDGTEVEYGPGDAGVIPPRKHDAWVVGKKPCVIIEFGKKSVFKGEQPVH